MNTGSWARIPATALTVLLMVAGLSACDRRQDMQRPPIDSPTTPVPRSNSTTPAAPALPPASGASW